MMNWMFGNYGMGYGGGMGFSMLFSWILIIIGSFLLIKTLMSGGKHETATQPGAGGDSAEEILNKRYARGEIGEAEFNRLRDNIR